MTEIRTKDKLFLALLVPAVAAGGYFYLWRADAVRETRALRARETALVQVEDHPVEKSRGLRERAAAEAECEAERAIPMPRAKMRGEVGDSLAKREQSVVCTLRAAGLQIVRIESAGAGTKGGETLRATGLRPEPAARRYTLIGSYPQVRRALETFAAREMAVIVDSLSMADAGANRWKLALWL